MLWGDESCAERGRARLHGQLLCLWDRFIYSCVKPMLQHRRLVQLYHRDANGTGGESGPVSMSGST